MGTILDFISGPGTTATTCGPIAGTITVGGASALMIKGSKDKKTNELKTNRVVGTTSALVATTAVSQIYHATHGLPENFTSAAKENNWTITQTEGYNGLRDLEEALGALNQEEKEKLVDEAVERIALLSAQQQMSPDEVAPKIAKKL